MNPGTPDQEPTNEEEKSKKIEGMKKTEETEEGLFSFAKSNTRDTVAYVILILGVVLLFFHPFFGAFLIGIVLGLYFADELISIFKNGNEFIEEQGMVRSIVIGVTAIAFFIALPGIFVGSALAIGLKYFFSQQSG